MLSAHLSVLKKEVEVLKNEAKQLEKKKEIFEAEIQRVPPLVGIGATISSTAELPEILLKQADENEKYRKQKISVETLRKWFEDYSDEDLEKMSESMNILRTPIQEIIQIPWGLFIKLRDEIREIKSTDKKMEMCIRILEGKEDVIGEETIRKLLDPASAKFSEKESKLASETQSEKIEYEEILNKMDELCNSKEEEREKLVDELESVNFQYSKERKRLAEKYELLKKKQPVILEIPYQWGKVLKVDYAKRIAYINIGSDLRVRKGLKFLAARRGKKYKYEYIAELEVKRTNRTWSVVSIIEVFNKKRPLQDGDLIVNPLFNPYGPLEIAFIPCEALGLKYSQSEATRRIREMGNKVVDIVSPTTNLAILMASPDPTERERQREIYEDTDNFKFAQCFGIPVLEAYEAFRFIGD
jgi:hypothetical protein